MSHPIIHEDKVKDPSILKQAIEVCPVGVFEEKAGKVVVAKPDECIGCRACEAICQNGEIIVVD
ncbi:MAG: ferredoxin [Nanoarchaeota archaeon]|nr:ferredoxin [Nanoarchaeota archaeon]